MMPYSKILVVTFYDLFSSVFLNIGNQKRVHDFRSILEKQHFELVLYGVVKRSGSQLKSQ